MIEVPKWLCTIIAIALIIAGILFNVCCLIVKEYLKKKEEESDL